MPQDTSLPSPETIHARRYLILVIVLAGVLMSVLDGIVTMTALLPVFGRVSQFTGRTRLFTWGFGFFSLSSLACGLAPSLAVLVACRVLQAVGGAMVFSISSALIYQVFPPGERGRAMGYLGSTVAIGGIAGPALGGFLVQWLGWRYIFFINVPIGAVVIAAALKHLRLPEERRPDWSMDWPGAGALILFLVGLLLFLGGLADGHGTGLGPPVTGAVSVLALAALILREARCREPLLKLGIFANLRFLLPLVVMFGFFIGGFMLSVIGPFFLQGVMGYRPAQVGAVYMVTPVVTAVGAPLSGRLYDRRPSPYLTPAGLAILGLSYLAFGWVALAPSLGAVAAIFACNGLGSALFQSPNNTELMNALPREELSIASSLQATMRNLGMTLGTSLAGLMVALQLRAAGREGSLLNAGSRLIAAISARVLWTAGGIVLAMALLALAGVRIRPGRRPG